ncbi:MAG: 3'-5' exonuclease [Kineosporiaceae bacterium]
MLDAERDRWAVVGVDDAQELTAAGQRLIDLLAGGGHALVLAGDPDVATLTFRGALPQTVAGAAERFRRADGGPARTVVLGTAHRYGPLLRAVADRVAARIGSAGTVAHRAGPGATHRSGAAHRADPVGPGEVPGPATPGAQPERSGAGEEVAVHVRASTAQEGAFVATWLRRRHLEQGVPWSRMAVVVRSARATRSLRRALGSAGVPVTVPGVEIAVRDEPAVLPLRLALRCCLDPEQLTAETAVALLSGPFGGVDAVALRRLRQALRAQELAGDGDRTSDALLVEALADPGHLATLDPRVAARARHVAALLQAGRRAADAPGATAETVLWALWEAAGVAEAWQRRALAGGQSGARADRDLDAVVALFDAAARHTDRLPHAGPGDFLGYLEGQELPSDTLAARAPDGEAVTLLTAAGAAGREWDAVAVPGVQEGTWPDLRLRNSLLGGQALADLLDGRVGDGADIVGGPGGPGGPGGSGRAAVSAQRRAVLDDELRLFHVAVSRARRALLVTAVRSEEELPSSFLDLVDPLPADADERPLSAVPRAMTLPSLIAELRGVAADTGEPSGRRHRAARHLAELARAGVPGADPGDWYGLAPLSSIEPLRAEDEPVRVSPSKVEQFTRCALRWLLETSGGSPGSSSSQLLGTLVHEIAERAPNGTRAELAALLADRIDRLGLGEGWVDDRERQRLRSWSTSSPST